MKQLDSPVRINVLHMRPLPDKHTGTKACNDADSRPTLWWMDRKNKRPFSVPTMAARPRWRPRLAHTSSPPPPAPAACRTRLAHPSSPAPSAARSGQAPQDGGGKGHQGGSGAKVSGGRAGAKVSGGRAGECGGENPLWASAYSLHDQG